MTSDPFSQHPADEPSDPASGGSSSNPSGSGEPEIVEGEIVDDAAAGPYRGTPTGSRDQGASDPFGDKVSGASGASGASGSRAGSPFGESNPFADGSGPIDGQGVGGLFGVGGPGAFGTLRMLAGNSPELRSMMTAPLRLLAIGTGVPAVIALLFGLVIDGNARFVAFGIAVLGGLAAVLLELRRRRLAAVPPPQRAGDPVPAAARPGHLFRLISFALFMMMLAIGFDLLALLLVIFGAW